VEAYKNKTNQKTRRNMKGKAVCKKKSRTKGFEKGIGGSSGKKRREITDYMERAGGLFGEGSGVNGGEKAENLCERNDSERNGRENYPEDIFKKLSRIWSNVKGVC